MGNKTINQSIKTLRNVATACLSCVVIAACAGSEGDGTTIPAVDKSFVPISFSTDVGTRANTLIDNIEALQSGGIGVFAYFTDEKTWGVATDDTEWQDPKGEKKGANEAYPIPDYMYNQQVSWEKKNVAAGAEPEEGWVYSPVKYWPNSTENKDPRYISFFAYAPWGTTGITEIPDVNDKTPHLKYKLEPNRHDMSDLLYATAIDAFRSKDGLIEISDRTEGNRLYTYQNVLLEFHHALALVEVYIQRIYDEPHYSGKAPENETDTKLFVSKLVLDAGTDIYDEGVLDLATGIWKEGKGETELSYTGEMLNESISGTTDTDWNTKWKNEDDDIKDDGIKDYGINEKEKCLFSWDDGLFFFPQELTLTPTLTYMMVTRVNELTQSETPDNTTNSENKYTCIVNEVTGNSLKLNIQNGKKYRLLIHVGVEHISFEVLSVVDWDFPMRFNPSVVKDFDSENKNHTLNENEDAASEENKNNEDESTK